jgi:HlyD family secretion protein
MKPKLRWTLIAATVPVLLLVVLMPMTLRSRADQGTGEDQTAEVKRGALTAAVIESGTIDSVKAVELKSRVTGRLARLLVQEGDVVQAGQLIAIVDPQETRFKVEQDQAQLKGAQSGVQRTELEMAQRENLAAATVDQARIRVRQMEADSGAQPRMTAAAIAQAEAGHQATIQERERLVASLQPNERLAAETAHREALANYDQAQREHRRHQELLDKGYVAARSAESAELQLSLARLRVESARDQLSRIEASQRAELARADAMVRQAEAELRRARQGTVQDQVKREEYRSALAELRKAEAGVQDVAILRKGRDQGQATVEQLASQLGDSRRQLSETEIRAPIGGIVTRRFVEEGELVAGLSAFSSGTSIVKIEDRQEMKVKLDVNEIDAARIREGMTAEIEVDALPDEAFSGVIQRIAPSSTTTSQPAAKDAVVRYEVEIRIDRSDPRLRSGMSARCSVEVLRRDAALLIPLEYVGKEGRDRFVMLYRAEGDPERRPIRLGAESGFQAEVIEGVREGDRLVKPEFKGPSRRGAIQFGRAE